jgi:tetratricopeptide (TPR) repeat protein
MAGGADEPPLDGVAAASAQARLMADPGALFALRRAHPEDPDVQLALARQLAAAGEPQLAHALARQLAAASPRSAERVAFAARTALEAGQGWSAVAHAAHLIAGPNGVRADGYALMAEGLLAQKRPSQARDAALQALAIAPGRQHTLELLRRIAEQLAEPALEAWALRRAAPPLRLGETVPVAQGAPGRCRLAAGWSAPEDWGAWTEGATAALLLELEKPVTGDLWITLQAHAFTPAVRPRCRVLASVLGHRLAEIEFEPSMTDHAWSFRCPRALAAASRVLKIHLDIPDAASPSELGLSPDPRRLGLALHSLRVDMAPRAAP